MFDLATVIRRFPLHELSIRRLYVRMPEFRSLCEDFATAKYALERWREDDGKVSDFQQLCEEIEAEIEEYIQGSLQTLRQHHREEET